ncbi:putative glyoxalase superfamily protein PhnB [Shimia isoporae]|uniref:Putative glyoxalase superfamily protein PhnB n=1 Tax=Shimia isoporae TaxID=647720 RepID=A0A4R1N414_9RHOB|nr:VOC family protein [Shimia isoporae]TCL00425.1 putative glyoxalase superfamily protein PhnB [Shimia isoporae]
MKLGYTIIYVADVPATVAFYETAFGLKQRFMHESRLYAEMDTGVTILSFSAEEAVELGEVTFSRNRREARPAGWEVCFVTEDVKSAFDRAVSHGCVAVKEPHEMPWGQELSYVRDLNGCLVEIATPMPAKTSDG